MTMKTIKAPGGERVNGRTTFGPTAVEFKNGVARVEDVSPALEKWLEHAGYTITDDEDKPDGPYDPADHNVDGEDGVLAYLAAADEDERKRVLEAEASGKARKTVLEWKPETPAGDGDGDGDGTGEDDVL